MKRKTARYFIISKVLNTERGASFPSAFMWENCDLITTRCDSGKKCCRKFYQSFIMFMIIFGAVEWWTFCYQTKSLFVQKVVGRNNWSLKKVFRLIFYQIYCNHDEGLNNWLAWQLASKLGEIRWPVSIWGNFLLNLTCNRVVKCTIVIQVDCWINVRLLFACSLRNSDEFCKLWETTWVR